MRLPTSDNIPQNYLLDFTSNQTVPMICCVCHEKFTHRKKRHIDEALKLNRTISCSHKCSNVIRDKKMGWGSRTSKCAECQQPVTRHLSQMKKSKSNQMFCNSSCFGIYNNKNKKHGTRRSKLENFLADEIRKQFPDLYFVCNDRTLIGYELDFWFPELKLAIELNGIVHYEPIYGNEKLERIQFNDKQKGILCLQNNTELCVIDTSSVNSLTVKVKSKYSDLIKQILCPLIGRNRRDRI